MTEPKTSEQRRRETATKRWKEALLKIGLQGDDDFARRHEFASYLRRPERTLRRWISGDHATPHEVNLILDWLAAGKITLGDLR